jgi:RES domain-containing protein
LIWRIGRSCFRANTSSGNAGRWNHRGVPVIYAASSLSLSAIEILAGSGLELPEDYVSVGIEIRDEIPVTTLLQKDLPQNWSANPHPDDETRDLGSAWDSKRETVILSVPSAVVQRERNYILNPAHSDFERFIFGQPEVFIWDVRLRPTPQFWRG